MGSSPHNRSGNDPVSDATLQLATDIHHGLVRDLGLPDGGQMAEASIDEQGNRYPSLLFGALAMHLADIKLPANASEADRARAVVEALRRIANSPRLLESITQAPYSAEVASSLLPQAVGERPVDQRAVELQRRVAESGYLERSMVSNNQLVQLHYETLEDIKLKRIKRAAIPAGSLVVIKLAPSDSLSSTVNLYRNYTIEHGYRNPLGKTREAIYPNIFTLVSAEAQSGLPKLLNTMIGKPVDIGKVGIGTRLRFFYDFWHRTQEVEGQKSGFGKREYRQPAELKQAFAGNTKDYPLFTEHY